MSTLKIAAVLCLSSFLIPTTKYYILRHEFYFNEAAIAWWSASTGEGDSTSTYEDPPTRRNRRGELWHLFKPHRKI